MVRCPLGRGHSSTCVLGDLVYLATADEEEQVQSLHAFDRTTGKTCWSTVVHKNGMTQKSNKTFDCWKRNLPASRVLSGRKVK